MPCLRRHAQVNQKGNSGICNCVTNRVTHRLLSCRKGRIKSIFMSGISFILNSCHAAHSKYTIYKAMLPTEWTIGQNEGRLAVPRVPTRIPHSRHGVITNRAYARRIHGPTVDVGARPSHADRNWRSTAAVEGRPRRIVHSSRPETPKIELQAPSHYSSRGISGSVHMDNQRIRFTVGSSISISSQSANGDSVMGGISVDGGFSPPDSTMSSSKSTLTCSTASSMSTACSETESSGKRVLSRCKQFFKRLNHTSCADSAMHSEKAWPTLADSSLTYVQSDSGLSFRSVSSGVRITPASSRGTSALSLPSITNNAGGSGTALWTSVGADGWVKHRQW